METDGGAAGLEPREYAALDAAPPGASSSSADAAVAPKPAPLGAYAAGHYLHAKAGMLVDKERVAAVVAELSRGSKYEADAKLREARLEKHLTAMRAQLANTSPADIRRLAGLMDDYAAELEAQRDLTRVHVHVDMDAFFASCEELRQPQLKGTAFAVGGLGMISTASYPARAYGVRSAMPGFVGLKLCPHLVFVPHHGELYSAAAAQARTVFSQYDDGYSGGQSLDEASLDLTARLRSMGALPADAEAVVPASSADAIAAVVTQMRQGVRAATGGLTCSAGVAANSLLAKVCSDVNKPDGQLLLPWTRASICDFLSTLSVRRVPGIGRVMERILAELGVLTCGDIVTHRGSIRAVFNERTSQWLLRCALGVQGEEEEEGVDDTGGVGRKSISQERTFADCGDWRTLCDRLLSLAHTVAQQMEEEHIVGRTVTVKMKAATFEVTQRGLTLPKPTSNGTLIAETAISLLRSAWPVRLRLIGVRVSALLPVQRGPTMLDAFARSGAGGGASDAAASSSGAVERAGPGQASCNSSSTAATMGSNQQQQLREEEAIGECGDEVEFVGEVEGEAVLRGSGTRAKRTAAAGGGSSALYSSAGHRGKEEVAAGKINAYFSATLPPSSSSSSSSSAVGGSKQAGRGRGVAAGKQPPAAGPRPAARGAMDGFLTGRRLGPSRRRVVEEFEVDDDCDEVLCCEDEDGDGEGAASTTGPAGVWPGRAYDAEDDEILEILDEDEAERAGRDVGGGDRGESLAAASAAAGGASSATAGAVSSSAAAALTCPICNTGLPSSEFRATQHVESCLAAAAAARRRPGQR